MLHYPAAPTDSGEASFAAAAGFLPRYVARIGYSGAVAPL